MSTKELTVESAGRNQVYLLLAFTISTGGGWLYRLALPLLVLQMTGSAVGTAFAYALEYIPYVLFSMVGGIVADRVDRRRLLVAADLVSAGLLVVLAAVVSTGLSQVWPVFLMAFLLSSVRPVHHPAFQSLIPSLVPAKDLTRANSRIQTVDSMFLVAGPVLGVGVVVALGTTTALWLNAISFVVSALMMTRIRSAAVDRRPADEGSGPRRQIWDDVREAARYLRVDRITLNGSLVMTGSAAGLMMVEANLVYYLVTTRNMPLSTVGIVLGAFGVGSVLGAVCAPSLSRRVPPGLLISAALLCAGLLTGLLAVEPGIVGMSVLWGCVGACVMAVIVVWFTLRQQIVPGRLLGRVVAVSRALAYAATPVAAVLGGWALSTVGGAPTLLLSAALQVAVAAMAFGTALRTARFPAVPQPV